MLLPVVAFSDEYDASTTSARPPARDVLSPRRRRRARIARPIRLRVRCALRVAAVRARRTVPAEGASCREISRTVQRLGNRQGALRLSN
eukprot:15844-Pelagococcus_subviridis.AAC.7